MKVSEAREAARQWILEQAVRIPGFHGCYSAGSTNWLADDADLAPASDLDLMVVLAEGYPAGARRKFVYRGALLEISYLQHDQLQTPDQILSDYHLAPSFATTKILVDPAGHLAPLQEIVSREYGDRRRVRRRCTNARDKMVAYLESIHAEAPLHDQAMGCLFAAGIGTHVLLSAGLRNPTVRTRYVAVRDLLAGYGHLEFQETLLELLGAAGLSPERVSRHLATLAEVFEAAARGIRTPFPFAADITDDARRVAIGGSAELIARGFHREAMFWIAVTHCRCRKILACDAPADWTDRFESSFADLLADLGVPGRIDVRARCAEIESLLPRLSDLAERIIAANPTLA